MIQKKKGFAKLDKILSATARQHKLEPAWQRYRALKHWQEAAGSFLDAAQELTRAIDLKDGILRVACLSREIAAQLKLLARRIIELLNNLLGKTVVRAIQIEF